MDAYKATVTVRPCGGECDAFGTEASRPVGVLHVASGDERAVFRGNDATHRKTRFRDVGSVRHAIGNAEHFVVII